MNTFCERGFSKDECLHWLGEIDNLKRQRDEAIAVLRGVMPTHPNYASPENRKAIDDAHRILAEADEREGK